VQEAGNQTKAINGRDLYPTLAFRASQCVTVGPYLMLGAKGLNICSWAREHNANCTAGNLNIKCYIKSLF